MTPILLFAASILPVSDTVQAATDTPRSTFSGRVIVANTGFAPVPAFSFDRPIVMGFASITSGRFIYEPDLSFGFNGKPWMSNNWMKYKVIARRKTAVKIGANPNLFFREDEVIQVQRTFVSELSADQGFDGGWVLSLAYQYVRGIDPGTLRGSFVAATLITPSIPVYKKLQLNLRPQVIHFDFNSDVGGTLLSTTALMMHQKVRLSLYFQGVLPVRLKFESEFKWNFGLVYIF